MTKKLRLFVICRKTVTEVTPSLTAIVYWPNAGDVPVDDTAVVPIAPFASVVTASAVNVIHPVGMPAEGTKVSGVFGLKPLTVRNVVTAAVFCGAYASPELTPPAPRVMVTFGVIENEDEAVLPLLSTTVMVCAPFVKSTDPVTVTTTVMALTVPTSGAPTVPVNEAVTVPVGVSTGVKVPETVPAVAQFALGVTVPACTTVESVVESIAAVDSANVAPAAAVAVPVLSTGIATTAAVAHVNCAVNKNTDVPCSVTTGATGARVLIML